MLTMMGIEFANCPGCMQPDRRHEDVVHDYGSQALRSLNRRGFKIDGYSASVCDQCEPRCGDPEFLRQVGKNVKRMVEEDMLPPIDELHLYFEEEEESEELAA